LVVDDNPSTRMVLTRALKLQGHGVVEADGGRRCLEILLEPREPAFDAVLLDLLMPDFDGYEVLARIQEEDELRHIPVIVVSAMDDLASAIRCVDLGAADYLPKPVNPALLKARLGAAIAERRLDDLESQLAALTEAVASDGLRAETLDQLDSQAGPVAELARVLIALSQCV
jgi:DNA-binding response OmpR family regulator